MHPAPATGDVKRSSRGVGWEAVAACGDPDGSLHVEAQAVASRSEMGPGTSGG